MSIEGDRNSTYAVELLEADVLDPNVSGRTSHQYRRHRTYPRQPLSRVAASIDGDTSIANRYGHPVASASGNVLDTRTRLVTQPRQNSQGRYVRGRPCLWQDGSSTRWLSGHWERV